MARTKRGSRRHRHVLHISGDRYRAYWIRDDNFRKYYRRDVPHQPRIRGRRRRIWIRKDIWQCCLKYTTKSKGTQWEIDCTCVNIGERYECVQELKEYMAMTADTEKLKKPCSPPVKLEWWEGEDLFGNWSIECELIELKYFKKEEKFSPICESKDLLARAEGQRTKYPTKESLEQFSRLRKVNL